MGELSPEVQNIHYIILDRPFVVKKPLNSRRPSWTRWGTWEAPATALAAAEAAGMPVRRPRRPAAVSAADAAGAGPELGCAGQLEQAAEAPIDEASSLCVGLSVDRSVDRSGLVSGRICIWCTRGWLPSRGFDPPAGCCRITETGLFWRLVSASRLSVGLRRCW
jgi:hypothetical protein